MNTSYWVSIAVVLIILVIGVLEWYSVTMPETPVNIAASSTTVKVYKDVIEYKATTTKPLTCDERTQALNKEAVKLQVECVAVSKECEVRSTKLYQDMANLLKDCDPSNG